METADAIRKIALWKVQIKDFEEKIATTTSIRVAEVYQAVLKEKVEALSELQVAHGMEYAAMNLN